MHINRKTIGIEILHARTYATAHKTYTHTDARTRTNTQKFLVFFLDKCERIDLFYADVVANLLYW